MNIESSKGIMICVGTIGMGVIAAFTYLKKQKLDNEKEVEKVKAEASYPPEYWVAKQAEAKARSDIRKAEIESSTRLTIDKRNRKDEKLRNRMEFEKNAPADSLVQMLESYETDYEDSEEGRKQLVSDLVQVWAITGFMGN